MGGIRGRVVGTLRALALGIVAAGVAGEAPAQPGGGPPPALVRLDTVRLEEINQWREVTGDLRAAQRSVLAAQEEGLVVEMAVEPGDVVEAGQVVARLDAARARIDVDRATAAVSVRRAEVDEARAALEQALRNRSRFEESFQRASASRQELDDAQTSVTATEARLAKAQADVETAQAELARAQKRLADMEIVSPFAGRVLEKRTEVGQWAGAGEEILEIVALDWIDAWLDVPQNLVEGLSEPGARVRIRVSALASQGGSGGGSEGEGGSEGGGGEMREAEVTAVVPSADRLSRLFPVRVRLDNRRAAASGGGDGAASGSASSAVASWNGRLKPGMSVVGLVPAGERRETLTVHKDAILRNETGAYVYMDAGGVAAIARVQTLFAVDGGGRVAVRSDQLRPGMRVVIEGNERMYPGQRLKDTGAAEMGRAADQPAAGAGQGG